MRSFGGGNHLLDQLGCETLTTVGSARAEPRVSLLLQDEEKVLKNVREYTEYHDVEFGLFARCCWRRGWCGSGGSGGRRGGRDRSNGGGDRVVDGGRSGRRSGFESADDVAYGEILVEDCERRDM